MVTKAEELEGAVDEMMERRDKGGVMDGIEYPFRNNMRLFNHVRFHHPDGTHSDIAGPTYNPRKPTPYLERFLTNWMKKIGPDGGRWFFLTRQSPAPVAPIRCFVEGCARTGGFIKPVHLYQHVMAKHGEESKMYADVLEEMKRNTQAQLDPEVLRGIGIGGNGQSAPKEAPVTTAEPLGEGPDLFRCTTEGCKRFFDTKQGRKLHETKGHK